MISYAVSWREELVAKRCTAIHRLTKVRIEVICLRLTSSTLSQPAVLASKGHVGGQPQERLGLATGVHILAGVACVHGFPR